MQPGFSTVYSSPLYLWLIQTIYFCSLFSVKYRREVFVEFIQFSWICWSCNQCLYRSFACIEYSNTVLLRNIHWSISVHHPVPSYIFPLTRVKKGNETLIWLIHGSCFERLCNPLAYLFFYIKQISEMSFSRIYSLTLHVRVMQSIALFFLHLIQILD